MTTIDTLAERYRSEGYQVRVNPAPEELPEFARDSGVNLYAERGKDIVVVHLEPDQSVLKASDAGLSYVVSLLEEAKTLLKLNMRGAAIISAWSAIEAAARDILRQTGAEIPPSQPSKLIESLLAIGRIDRREANQLFELMHLRNAVVHGVRPEDIPTSSVVFLIDMVRKLVRTAAQQGRGSDSAFISIVGDRLDAEGVSRGLIVRPNALLQEVVGNSTGVLSALWDLAHDGQGHLVITLTLSDWSGSVTTTFSPPELLDQEQLRFRLTRTWGDLLRVRSHKEIEEVLRTSGTIENG
jgi:REase_AHJR-like